MKYVWKQKNAWWLVSHINMNKSNEDGWNGNWSLNIYKNSQSVFDDYIKPTIGHVRLRRSTLIFYQKEFIDKLKQTLRLSILKLYHRFVIIALNAAVKHGKLEKNTLQDVILTIERDVKEGKLISLEES